MDEGLNANYRPLAYARGSERSRDREGAVGYKTLEVQL